MEDLLEPNQPGALSWAMAFLSVLACAFACCTVLYASAFVRAHLAEGRIADALQQDPADELLASRSLAQIQDRRSWKAMLPTAKPFLKAPAIETKLLNLLLKLQTGDEQEARQLVAALISPVRNMARHTAIISVGELAVSMESYEQTLSSNIEQQPTLEAALREVQRERARIQPQYALLSRGIFESLQIPSPEDSYFESMPFYGAGLLAELPAHPLISDGITDEDSLGLLVAAAQAKAAGERAVEIMKGRDILQLLEGSRDAAKALKDELEVLTKQEDFAQAAINSLKVARRQSIQDLSYRTKEAILALSKV